MYFQKISNYILILIVILGVGLRLYKFPQVPIFTDEVREALVSYHFYHGKYLPLTNYAEYIGPIYNYMLTISMYIFGISVWTPRYVVFIFGVITIISGYRLGKIWVNNYVGLITAAYISLSPTLILINSRISWATCIAPFFVAELFIQLKKFTESRSYRKAILIGVYSAVLIQLHPLMVFVVMPVFLQFAYYSRLKRFNDQMIGSYMFMLRYLGLYFVAAIIVSMPLIAANINDPWVSVKGAEERQHLSENMLLKGAGNYFSNVDREFSQTEHLIKQSVIFEEYIIPEFVYRPIYYVNNWDEFLLFSMLVGVLFIILHRKWQFLIFPFVICLFLLCAPLLTSDYFEGLKIRYYSGLIPLFAILIGYSFYCIYKLMSKNDILKYFYVAIFITIMTTPPIMNLYTFFSRYEDQASLNEDIIFLREKSADDFNFYYMQNSDYDYAMVEYLSKFSNIPANKIHSFDLSYSFGEKNILLLPDEISDDDETVINSFLEKYRFVKIYEGDNIYAYSSSID